jgi:thiol-disulfide isomerase/thioredoxin
LQRKDLSRENKGLATLALAEVLARKYEYIDTFDPTVLQDAFIRFLDQQRSPDWGKDLIPANAPQFKAESIQLFHEVLAHYANVPVTASVPYFGRLKNLGEKAKKNLHALEHLTIGSESPRIVGKDLEGKPLDLSEYRGRVVMVSFWFTGCGPCMDLIPQERRLIETYKGRPFALLGVCGDESLLEAKKTAASHAIDWPCWFDGRHGPIASDWNVLGWPTIYLLDRHGVIVAKNVRGERLDRKIAQVIQERK